MLHSTARRQYKNVSLKAIGREHFNLKMFKKIVDSLNAMFDGPGVGMCVNRENIISIFICIFIIITGGGSRSKFVFLVFVLLVLMFILTFT